MRKLILNSAIAMAMGSVSFAGLAAESASLSVVGDINPATCDVSLSNASIDLGTISMTNLTADMNPKVGTDITVNVACDAPAAVAIQTTDNRSSSAMTMAEVESEMNTTISGMTDINLFGLGNDTDSNKVGALMLVVSGATVDGSSNTNVLGSTDRATWTAKSVSPSTGLTLSKDGYFASAIDADSTSPMAVTNATYTISSGIFLRKADMYPSGENVALDGNVTFSVVYL